MSNTVIENDELNEIHNQTLYENEELQLLHPIAEPAHQHETVFIVRHPSMMNKELLNDTIVVHN